MIRCFPENTMLNGATINENRTVSMAFTRYRCRHLAAVALLAIGVHLLLPIGTSGQQTNSERDTDANTLAVDNDATTTTPAADPTIWDLAVQGGIFMIPIVLASIVVIAFSIERLFGLRTNRILPPKILAVVQQLGSKENGLDPRKVYRLCRHDKSPLGRAIRASLLKIGRPLAEVEKTVEDTVVREAARMANNIRPINVAASVSPLLGLLGTVQGMIMAFMVTSTTTATGTAKGQELAQGIYTALVTTFSGLCVAIPAVLLTHFLEGRIDRLLRKMEELFQEILPRFEQFEGKIRVQHGGTKGQKNHRPPGDASAADSPPPMEERPPIQSSFMRDAIERPNE